MKTIQSQSRALWCTMWRELCRIVSSPVCLICMIGMPLFAFLFFLTMMNNGLPEKLPVAVVDLDNSNLSRDFVRQLASQQQLRIENEPMSFSEARDAMQRNEIFGFLVIPSRFEELTMAARQPEISFYTNNAYFIPGSLLYKSFKTLSVLASGEAVGHVLTAAGIPEANIKSLLLPINAEIHPIGNPWLNYSIYLNNSFIPATLQLMVLMVTIYSIGIEIKHGTSRRWMRTSENSIVIAMTGKLLPQTCIFTAIGVLGQSVLYGFLHFPLHCPTWHMIFAMLLLIIASQGLAVILLSFAPSLRVGFSAGAVIGILSFSLGGFSFPVSSMYAPLGMLSCLLPVRHYFLIYISQALNGYPLYYCRWHYVALIGFAVASLILLGRLKKALLNPQYEP